MSVTKLYILAFVGCLLLAVVLAFTLENLGQGWEIMLIMGVYGTGMYFQGRWHEADK